MEIGYSLWSFPENVDGIFTGSDRLDTAYGFFPNIGWNVHRVGHLVVGLLQQKYIVGGVGGRFCLALIGGTKARIMDTWTTVYCASQSEALLWWWIPRVRPVCSLLRIVPTGLCGGFVPGALVATKGRNGTATFFPIPDPDRVRL